MDQASIKDHMSDHAESSAAAISRNDDLITIALRSEDSIDLDDIVRLARAVSPLHDVPSSLGTLTTTAISTFKESNGTKPTSTATSYPVEGKGKAVATYESSLSATHGSASEAEAEKEQDFVGIGGWTGDAPLKGTSRARKRRQQTNRRSKQKKPVVIIQHNDPSSTSPKEGECSAVENITRRSSKETKYLRRRPTKFEHEDNLTLAEEGRIMPSSEEVGLAPHPPLSRTRRNVLVGLCVAAILTFIGSTYGAHHTGRAQMAHTKSIIFSATVILSFLTVVAMVVAKRSLQEALLAGLFESLIGFVLVVEIREFM